MQAEPPRGTCPTHLEYSWFLGRWWKLNKEVQNTKGTPLKAQSLLEKRVFLSLDKNTHEYIIISAQSRLNKGIQVVLSIKGPKSKAPRKQCTCSRTLKTPGRKNNTEALCLSNMERFHSEYSTTAQHPAELPLPAHRTGLSPIPSTATRSLQLDTQVSTPAPQFQGLLPPFAEPVLTCQKLQLPRSGFFLHVNHLRAGLWRHITSHTPPGRLGWIQFIDSWDALTLSLR